MSTTRDPPLRALSARLSESERWPLDRLRSSQLRQLRVLAEHAVRHCAHYRETLGLDVASAARLDWQDWRSLPVLPRVVVQEQRERLVAATLPAKHGAVRWQYTTGSTGRPLRVASSDFLQFVYGALTFRDHRWHGRDPLGRLALVRAGAREGDFDTWGTPVAELHGTGPARVLDVRRPVDEQLARLREFDPHYLLTYATNAHALARRALELGVALSSLREVRVFGELPRPDLAQLCGEAFGALVSDVYSAEETGPMAAQCSEEGCYHVHAEAVLLEVLDESGCDCAPGELGRVVVTPMHNLAMPLLRYEIGDYAVQGEACACGRSLPVLARIAGRRRNMLELPDGSSHWPSFPATVWLPYPCIRKVQLAQTALDSIEVRVEATRDLDTAERERLFETLGERLGWPLRFTLRRFDRIGRDEDYKFEDFVSLLDRAG